MGNKTLDGLKVVRVARMISLLPGIQIRVGKNHPFIATRSGAVPCPIASSTHVKNMVVPWIAQATGYNKKEIYSSLRFGTWQYT
jgi:hypothetical protein|tara:strand:- start:88 stop:339 length:252 start_codon:yes stop_codon:yes gene_type:complete